MRIVNSFVVGMIFCWLCINYINQPKQCTLQIGKTLVQGDAIN